jgi:hypothetical protein
MKKVSQDILLRRAENEFIEGNFEKSLRSYGLILRDHPALDEAKVGACLSDLGFASRDEAQALFDYYQIIKNEKENAVDIIDGLLDSLEHTQEKLQALLIDPIDEQIEYGDGIRYSDFLKVVDSRGSFKETFEDIMFSTKVIISEKDEFIDFVTKLSKEGFDEMALNYLDATAQMFGNDQEVLALYHVVSGNHK